MKMRNRGILILAILGIIFIGSACDPGYLGEEETIIVQNRSGVNGVQVYINGVYKGTVDNNRDLTAKDSDWDDTDVWIDARNSICEWNTIYLSIFYGRLDDGETATVTLGLPKQSPSCWEGPGSITDIS